MLNRTLNVEGDPLGQIASLITVRDIFTPFVAVFDAARQIPDVWEEWSMELAVDESPLDQMALVVSDGEPVGSLTFDELDEEKGELSNCVDAIHLDRLITDDMPLMQAVKMFAEEDADYYLYVISGNELVGWLSYPDLFKLPLRLCLFAELLSIEERMLSIIQRDAAKCFSQLPPHRRQLALNTYARRKYDRDEFGNPYPQRLVACTCFTDKKLMLLESPLAVDIPAVSEQLNMDFAERLRNDLAHASAEADPGILVGQEKLGPFLAWLDRLDTELNKALLSASST